MAPPKSKPPLIDLTVDVKEEPKEKQIKQESSSTSNRSGRKAKKETKEVETLVKHKKPKNKKNKSFPHIGNSGRVESLRPQYSLSDVKSDGNLTEAETKIANLQFRLQKSNNEANVNIQALTNEITYLNNRYSTDASQNLQTIRELQKKISQKDKLLEQSQMIPKQQNERKFEIEALKSTNALLREELQQMKKKFDDLKDKRARELIQMEKLKKELKELNELKEKHEGSMEQTNPRDPDEIIETYFRQWNQRAPKRESSGDGGSIVSEIPPKIQKRSDSEVKNEEAASMKLTDNE